MFIDELISEERKQELEKELEKEIFDLENKIICKRKFIFYIKKYGFIEFCYLYGTYIGITEETSKQPLLKCDGIELITDLEDYHFDIQKRTISYKIQDVKKIKSIENMALKGKRRIKANKQY